MPTRARWQQLSEDRILDAQAQLAASRWSAAYYLIGYAVDCGLKSCVLARVAAYPEMIYEDRKFSNDAWTHDIEGLLRVADLRAMRDHDAAAAPSFEDNRQMAKDWTEQSRYQQTPQARAQDLFDAVTDPNHGVMRWIRLHW